MAKGSGMGPGGHSERPIDDHTERARGAGVQHGADYDPPLGYPTPKGAHKLHGGQSVTKADFGAELHDMSGHLGHHSSGSAHENAFSGGGKTVHSKHHHKK